MKPTVDFTPNDWEFGVGFSLPCEGNAISGLRTIRPFEAYLMLGPITLTWTVGSFVDIVTRPYTTRTYYVVQDIGARA